MIDKDREQIQSNPIARPQNQSEKEAYTENDFFFTEDKHGKPNNQLFPIVGNPRVDYSVNYI